MLLIKLRQMKRTAVFLLVLILGVSLFAANGQKVIPLESDVYRAIDELYILEGKAVPSTTRPWTVAETVKILSKVSKETSVELYSIVEEAVKEEPKIKVDDIFGMTFGGYASITGYVHTNKGYAYPFNDMTNNLFRSEHEVPTFRADWEAWVGEHLYSFVWYQYKNEYYNNGYSDFNFDFDIANLTPKGLTTDMDQREPSRAFFVVGSDSWSLEYGRDRLLMGAGNSGSLVFSNTMPYQHLLRFSLFGNRYKYSFIMSFYPHLCRDEEHGIQEGGDGILFYMTHRLECRFMSDRLYAAVNESIMYRKDGGVADIRYVNPVMYFHNYFISDYANSIVDLEASYTFAKGWNLYGQFAMDQFASPVEKAEGQYNEPLAFGAMLGLKNVSLAGKGVLTIVLEGAYTMPYLYLRAKSIEDPDVNPVQDVTDPGLGYIGSYRGNLFYIGYRYGGDAIVADLKLSYEVPSSWIISAEGLYMVHGEKNIRSLFTVGDDAFAPSGESWSFILLELSAKKHLSKSVSAYFRYDMIQGSRGSDNQFALGIEVGF